MDIKDEIDAMLDNLKNSGQNVNNVTKQPQPEIKKKTTPLRNVSVSKKSVYDNMSVEDLLSALSEDKKTTESNSKHEEINEKFADENLNQANDSLNISEVQESKGLIQSNETTNVIAQPEEKTNDLAEYSVDSDTVKQPKVHKKRRKKHIEVDKDLPDYDTEKNSEQGIVEAPESIEKIMEESESESQNSSVDETFVENNVSVEAIIENEVTNSVSDEGAADDSDADSEQITEALNRNGLFSAVKSIFSHKKKKIIDESIEVSNTENIFDESEKEITQADESDIAPENDDSESKNISEKAVETDNETILDADIENTSAMEMIDAALAANGEIDSDLENESEISETNDDSSTELLIEDIREDAANAISELEADDKIISESDDAIAESSLSEENSDDEVNIDVSVGVQRKKSRFVNTLEKILEENPEVISEQRSEKIEEDDINVSFENKNNGKFKKRLYVICGVIFTLLAIVGFVSTVENGILYFRNFTAGEVKQDSFKSVIYPAVIMDIESFSSPSELSSEQIISAALWSLVMSADDMDKYEKTFDVISVPAVDVEVYAAQLFGDNLPELTHATVGSGELKFYYNEDTKSYNVPVSPISFTYEPDITSVSKNGNIYTLDVDYIKELPAWVKESSNYEKEISKTVEFKLSESNGEYYITSMTVLNVNSAL